MDINLNKLLQESLHGSYLEHLGIGNENILKWALKIDPEGVVLHSSEELSKAMYCLTQYAAFLQGQSNMREATFLYEKRKFSREISSKISKYKGTVSEREAIALQENKDLQLLEERVTKSEIDFIMFKKMPEAMLEKVNVIKKELSRRGVDKA